MIDHVDGSDAASRCAAYALLLAALLAPLHVCAAPVVPKASIADSSKARAGILKNFAMLSMTKPKICVDDQTPERPVAGWRRSPAQCAWQNLLQVRRWETDLETDSINCVSKQARWWASAHPRVGPHPAWNRDWQAQTLIDEAGVQKRIAMIERTASGSWLATEWRWTPSQRASTRKWQEGRWKLLTDAAMVLRQTSAASQTLRDADSLLVAWEQNLNGSPAEISAETRIWRRDRLCMKMQAIGLDEAQLYLPYSREDWRLEQRAAMRIRLARSYPKAVWLTPFRLLPMAETSKRGGAKYEAIWLDNGMVKGQVWIPTSVNGTILRTRIEVAMSVPAATDADAAMATTIATSIERELVGLASTWAGANER